MIKRIKEKLNNLGNTFIVVLVSVTCMMILIATILAVIGYYYRTRAVDLENKRNFYYVEQALDDIYAGIGNDSISALMNAYKDTVDVMVYFDAASGRYVTIDSASANLIMRQKFLQRMATNTTYVSQQELYKHLRSFISGVEGTTREDKTDASGEPAEIRFYNTAEGIDYTIELVNPKNLSASDPRMYLEVVTRDVAGNTEYEKLVIHNVTLKRTTTEGYVQSLTTDIVISEPEFEVAFSNVNNITNAIYDFSLLADMGVEFNRATEENETISITGNVYAGSDYYNKVYNEAAETRVSNYDTARLANCDGQNEKSRFSGIYTDATNVNIMAEKVIVPGSIAVMNDAKLSITGNPSAMGSSRNSAVNLWADNIIMSPSLTLRQGVISDGGQLLLNADAYIADDMEINEDNAEVQMVGNYYGYNYSQTDESGRTLSQYAASGKAHFNSSAIIVNGNNALLDFSGVTTLHVAGRSYIETSQKKDVTVSTEVTGTGENQTTTVSATTSYIEQPGNTDVQTGESISVKSNQIAYMPLGTMVSEGKTIPKFTEIDSVNVLIYEDIKGWLDEENPILVQSISEKSYYFLNFKSAADATKFFDWYANTLPTLSYFEQAADLVDIKAYSDYNVSNILLGRMSNSRVVTSGSYTSGVLNVARGRRLTITSPTDNDTLINGTGESNTVQFTTLAKQYNNDYKEMKYTLQVIDTSNFTGDALTQAQAAKADLNTKDSKDLTPINFFMDFSQFNTKLVNGHINGTESTVGRKVGNYYIWISDGDVNIEKPSDSDGTVMGLIIAKGDVNFNDAGVTRFEGLVISGSKILVDHPMNFIANPEIVKTVLRTADATKCPTCKGFGHDAEGNVCPDCGGSKAGDISGICKLFKDYSDDASGSGSGGVSAGNIEVGDVLQYENWKKNIE